MTSINHSIILAKRVKLTRGNLVLDCPVPSRYLQSVPIKDTKEFTHMRYTGKERPNREGGEGTGSFVPS